MTLLDAYALAGYLDGEPAVANAVEPLIGTPLAMSVLNMAEVVDRALRLRRRLPEELRQDLAVLERAGLRMVPLTDEIAFRAAELRARYYRRRACDVSMADCVAAATALSENLSVATASAGLAAVMRGEGGEVYALPTSRGTRP